MHLKISSVKWPPFCPWEDELTYWLLDYVVYFQMYNFHRYFTGMTDQYLTIFCKIALSWTSEDFKGDKLTMVEVMAWWCHLISHCLNQCWPHVDMWLTLGHWIIIWSNICRTTKVWTFQSWLIMKYHEYMNTHVWQVLAFAALAIEPMLFFLTFKLSSIIFMRHALIYLSVLAHFLITSDCNPLYP